jgi:hypothetical protein
MKKMKTELEEERKKHHHHDGHGHHHGDRKKRQLTILEVTIFLLLIAPFVGSAYALLIVKMMQATAGMLR